MPQIIPAAPGWYIAYGDKDDQLYDAVVAWQEAADDRGDAILLPYTDNGPGFPPVRWSTQRLLREEGQVVYRPDYKPEYEA
ncbi:hypothetical protein M2163_000992 [Streptomyces sp. SAI-135]|uniref:hypothetical protein n=1 Tax=unclassified Streptomyces TaxID=2593676 RepID=UPI0024765AD4|nr:MULTISPECIES: hypothetical protein [unclassified Streptomyces]MDH6522013.1 hypothetical protein [Streptomyces sp. SAI-090]MDH6573382.1 hypothetical protein [Streptomyces sp. SAI-117]MDH6613884.1 hypothetical protein [Streptomyces sp. SAI-135]